MSNNRSESFVEGVPEITASEITLGVTAMAGMIGSIFLKGRASNIAFGAGAVAFVPFVYKTHQAEEAYHRANPWIRDGSSRLQPN